MNPAGDAPYWLYVEWRSLRAIPCELHSVARKSRNAADDGDQTCGTWHQSRPLEDVNINHYECQSLFGAGKGLMGKSGLARYCGDSSVCNNDEAEFEKYWRTNFDPDFGRCMAWVWFSVGAET